MITKTIFSVRIAAILSFLFIATSVFSQKESVVYIGINGKLTTFRNAVYMQKVIPKSSKSSIVQTYQLKESRWDKIYSERYKKLNDSTWMIKGIGKNMPEKNIRTFAKQADGTFKFTDVVSERVLRSGTANSVLPLLAHGKVTEYYLGGRKKSVSYYNNNELVSNENWNEDGTKWIDNVFYSVDNYPFYNPGNEELHAHIIKGFKDADIDVKMISGSIKLGFVVMENGTIDGIKIISGLGPVINGVAVESFNSLKGTWTPAKLNNKTVRYFQVFPINFRYNETHIEFAELRGGILHFQH